ncbi:MAG TPA: hypothetical protein VHF89_07955 [Solirubrobacteraceae bacterium]|nr:hypothetical protein [Solirubrobacteraceae bacterium]
MATDQATGVGPIPALDSAVKTILTTPPLPALPGVPSLPDDLASAKADAKNWPDGIRDRVIAHANAAGAGAATFTKTTAPALHKAAAAASGGDQSAVMLFVSTLESTLGTIAPLQDDAEAVTDAVKTFHSAMAEHASVLAGDGTKAASSIAAGEAEAASLREELKKIEFVMALDKRVSRLSWATGVVGHYLLHSVDEFATQRNLQRAVQALNGRVSNANEEVLVLTACVNSLGWVVGANDHILTSLTSLMSGLATLKGVVQNTAEAVEQVNLADQPFVDDEIDNITTSWGDVATETATLLDGVTT